MRHGLWIILVAGCEITVTKDTETITTTTTDTTTDVSPPTLPTEPTEPTEPTGECGPNPPAVDLMTCAAVAGAAPTVVCSLQASDADGALHELSLIFATDDVLDGTVTGPTSVADFTVDAPACEAGLISADLTIGWSGIFGQWVEIAMQVRDADGQVSDALVVTACAPNEDGTLADCGPLPVDTGDTGAPDDTGAPVETGDTGGGTTTPPDTGGTSTPTDTGAAETGDTGVL